MKKLFLLFLLHLSFAYADAQIITTVIGNGSRFYNGDNIDAINAGIGPEGIAVDDSGNIYIADRTNRRIRKVDKDGIITTIAGTGILGYSGDGGPATAAEISQPFNIAVDHNGNLYFTDGYVNCNCVRKIQPNGIITTIAGNGIGSFFGDGGPATAAELWGPAGLTLDTVGNIYIVDVGNNRIRKIDNAGIITTIAGNDTAGYSGDGGPATAAKLRNPSNIALDGHGNIYINDAPNLRVRKIDASGIITTFAGNGGGGNSGDNGPATDARLTPYSITVDKQGNVFVGDNGTACVVRMISTTGIITTVAGTGHYGYSGDGGPATAAELNAPVGLAFDKAGGLLLSDSQNGRIRYIASGLLAHVPSAGAPDFAIYPNPVTTGMFIMHITAKTVQQAKVTITDISGKTVREFDTVTGVPVNVAFDAPPGLYWIIASMADGSISKEILVSR